MRRDRLLALVTRYSPARQSPGANVVFGRIDEVGTMALVLATTTDTPFTALLHEILVADDLATHARQSRAPKLGWYVPLGHGAQTPGDLP